jgi:hypothetical protein
MTHDEELAILVDRNDRDADRSIRDCLRRGVARAKLQ